MPACKVTIEAPDPLGANLIEIELKGRGLEVAQEGNRITTAVADRGSADALRAVIGTIAQGATIAIDDTAAAAVAPGKASDGSAAAFAIVVGPSAERREKWDSVVRRIETQIGRDAGRPVRRNGASFAVAGFETRDAAAQASAAVVKGLMLKFGFEDARVVVVPETAAELVLNVEADRRALLIQLGYTTESACLLQVFVADPAARESVASAISTAGVRLATCDQRLVAGFSTAGDARALVERLELPADAAVQISMATSSIFDLGSRLRQVEENALALELPYMYWDATLGGV